MYHIVLCLCISVLLNSVKFVYKCVIELCLCIYGYFIVLCLCISVL